MTHEPLCYLVGCDDIADICVSCEFIRKVRADERARTIRVMAWADEIVGDMT